MSKMDLDRGMHIHDEIVVTGNHIEEMEAIMNEAPEWATGLPLKTEAVFAERFKKV